MLIIRVSCSSVVKEGSHSVFTENSLQLNAVGAQLMCLSLGTAPLLLRHTAALRQAALTQPSPPQLLPQLTHLQQQELSQALRTILLCRKQGTGDSVGHKGHKGQT